MACMLAFAGCKDDEYDNKSPFDNVAYLNVSENSDTQVTTFKKTLATLQKDFSVVLSYPSAQPVEVTVQVDPALVDRYNARNNTSWKMLDSKYYELSAGQISIPAGKTVSDQLSLELKNLDGSGDAEELPIDETYLVPVTISQASGIALLQSSATAYYVVKRSSAITSAASLRDNWINFPTLDKASEGSMLFNNLTAWTTEAWLVSATHRSRVSSSSSTARAIRPRRPASASSPRRTNPSCSTPGSGTISPPPTTMPRARSASTSTANFKARVPIWATLRPHRSTSQAGLSTTSTSRIPSRTSSTRAGAASASSSSAGPTRVWSVARTADEIWENMYDVDPHTTGLIGYWKFDEGQGNVIRDWTGNGNDGVAENDLEWPEGIEVPQINRE